MQDLSHFNAASHLTSGMAVGPQFVRIMSGPRSGTIGRVSEIRMKYYSAHEYKIACTGRRAFWVKGEDLEHLPGYTGETEFVKNDDYQVTHTDMMGKELSVGQTIMFTRVATGAADMCMGTIQKITKTGVVYAKVFKMAREEELPTALVKVGVPASSIVIDRGTVDNILLAKLAVL